MCQQNSIGWLFKWKHSLNQLVEKYTSNTILCTPTRKQDSIKFNGIQSPILSLPHWCSCSKKGTCFIQQWRSEDFGRERRCQYLYPSDIPLLHSGSFWTNTSSLADTSLRRKRGQGGCKKRGQDLVRITLLESPTSTAFPWPSCLHSFPLSPQSLCHFTYSGICEQVWQWGRDTATSFSSAAADTSVAKWLLTERPTLVSSVHQMETDGALHV